MRVIYPFKLHDTDGDLGAGVHQVSNKVDKDNKRFYSEVLTSADAVEEFTKLFSKSNFRYAFVVPNHTENHLGEPYYLDGNYTIYAQIDDLEADRCKWRFKEARVASGDNLWVFTTMRPTQKQPVWTLPLREDMLSFMIDFEKHYSDQSMESLSQIDQAHEFLEVRNGVGLSCPVFEHLAYRLTIDNQTYVVQSKASYQEVRKRLTGSQIKMLDSCPPSHAFYSQYKAYHGSITPPLYEQMLEHDVAFRRLSVSYSSKKSGFGVKVFQQGLAIETIVESNEQISWPITDGDQPDFERVNFPVLLQHTSRIYQLDAKMPLREAVPVLATSRGSKKVIGYKDLISVMPSGCFHQFCSEYVFVYSGVSINHACFKKYHHGNELLPYVRKRGRLSADMWRVATEAWYKPFSCFWLKVSNRAQKQAQFKWGIAILLLLIVGVCWEGIATANDWQMSLGVFHSMRVWQFSLIILGVTIMAGYGLYRFLLRYTYWSEYEINIMPISEYAQTELKDLSVSNTLGASVPEPLMHERGNNSATQFATEL